MNGFFENGIANVGGKDVVFEKRVILGDFFMYVPRSFCEDESLVSNYSYLFSKDKSPLSVSVKYSPVADAGNREQMISDYFDRSHESKLSETETLCEGILYREAVTSSKYISVYSLRFSVEIGDGVLFGCFTCSARYKDDWNPVVLQMLLNIETA